ncbi:MAG TPA: ATP-binding protein [Dehalococcoidia bacterium]|nr:ATP-binding protein [Dehalococcoidia bacterium]
MAVTLAATAILVGALAPFRSEVGLLNAGFIFLLLTLIIAAVWGREVGIFAALLINLAFNFFFIDPLFQFTVQQPRNVVALVVFLIVSVIGGTLLASAREAAAQARRRQAEAEVALTLSRSMSGQTEPQQALETLCREVTRAFDSPGAAVLTRTPDGWSVVSHDGSEAARRPTDAEEQAMADRAVALGTVQGLGETGLDKRTKARRIVRPGRSSPLSRREQSVALVPLKLGDRVLGVLRLDGPIGATPFRDQPAPLLSAVAGEAAVALQRMELAKAAAHAEALRQADEMKTALLASISHDLKTPLATIKAAISSILDARMAWSDEDLDAFHQTIDAQTERLNRLISDILDLNRIESGMLTPDQTPLRANDLLERAREITSISTGGRTVTVSAPSSLRLLTDESLIIQALVNLIENAAKYSTQGGSIHLSAAESGSQVVLTVADEGPGIPPADLPHVFDRFYRAQESSRRVKGSGLGLSIVKGFVELCGGTVEVRSGPDGTVFSIRLPAAPAAERVTA